MKLHVPMLAALALAAAACSRAGFDDHAFEWTAELPAGATVHLLDGSGEITVRPASTQSASVTGTRRWRRGRERDIRFAVSHTGNDYYICAMWRNSGKCGARGYRGKSTGGLLAMFSLFHRGTDASADLIAEIPANVTVDAKTSNGSVTVAGIAAGVTARTANGNVEASDVSGPLSLATTNGDVRLSAAVVSPSDPISLTTTNGNVRAELPAGTEGAFDLSVVNGSVESDFPLNQMSRARIGRHLVGQIGSSTRVVKMRSVNGGVFVTSRPPAAAHE